MAPVKGAVVNHEHTTTKQSPHAGRTSFCLLYSIETYIAFRDDRLQVSSSLFELHDNGAPGRLQRKDLRLQGFDALLLLLMNMCQLYCSRESRVCIGERSYLRRRWRFGVRR
jgi:hypothetical protein